MTDNDLSENGLDSVESAGDASQPVQDVQSEQVNTQAITGQERMFTQSEVNNMNGTVRRKAYEKGLEAARSQSQTESQSQQHSAANGVDESHVRELVNSRVSEITKQQKAALDKQNVEEYAASIYKAIDANAEDHKDEIPDFKEAMESVDGFANYPGILMAAHKLDNSAKVLRYLASDEGLGKLSGLATLSEKAVSARIQKISNGLKQNESARKSPVAPNPVSQIDSTTNGIGRSRGSSLEEWKSSLKT